MRLLVVAHIFLISSNQFLAIEQRLTFFEKFKIFNILYDSSCIFFSEKVSSVFVSEEVKSAGLAKKEQ